MNSSDLHSKPRRLLAYGVALPLLRLCLKVGGLQLPDYISIRERFRFLLFGYDEHIKSIAQRVLRPGDIAVDIGAHVGLVSRPLAKLVGTSGRVFAFEPDPSLFGMLKHNVATFTQISPHQVAISDQSSRATFHLHPTSGMSNSLVNTWEGGSSISVECTSFDDWISRNAVSKIRLIKIDVEGAEPLVLRGMHQTLSGESKPSVILEFCPGNLGGAEAESMIFEILQGHGYRISSIDSHGNTSSVANCRDAHNALNENGYVNLLAQPY